MKISEANIPAVAHGSLRHDYPREAGVHINQIDRHVLKLGTGPKVAIFRTHEILYVNAVRRYEE